MTDLPLLPKLCGADIELGNFVLGVETSYGTGSYAVRRLLAEFDGIPAGTRWVGTEGEWRSAGSAYSGGASSGGAWAQGTHFGEARFQEPYPGHRHSAGGAYRDGASSHGDGAYPTTGSRDPRSDYGYGTYRHGDWAASDGRESAPAYDPQDLGRKFLASNGSCVYEDLSHLELCLPEVLSPFDWVAAWGAMLRLAQQALDAANRRQDPAHPIRVLVNNSDGLGQSYGSHLDFLVTRRSWDNLFRRKLHHQAFLAAFQVSGIVLTGQGKVGSENGAPPVQFQLTQRGDFYERLVGHTTTHRRPILNTRDEPLCGRTRVFDGNPRDAEVKAARLHMIFPDSTLCPVASLLKVGTAQIVLAMLEAEAVDTSLALDDPLEALTRWGHDPTLAATARLTSGTRVTAVELQQAFLDSAMRFVADGRCEGIVPRSREVIELWQDTLERLRGGDMDGLLGRLDWVTKWVLLRDALAVRPRLGWGSPEIKHLDHHYASLGDGLFQALDADGAVTPVVAERDVERFCREPPPDTRAWGRAMLLRLGGPESVAGVDWDFVRLRLPGRRSESVSPKTVELADPLGWTRRELGPVIAEAHTVQDLLDRIGAVDAAAGQGWSFAPARTAERPVRAYLPAAQDLGVGLADRADSRMGADTAAERRTTKHEEGGTEP